MSRPQSPNDCISRYSEANDRMTLAWKQSPSKNQKVFIVREGKIEEWNFSWFTYCGARLYTNIDGRHYGKLINWDKGDHLFTSRKDACLCSIIFHTFAKVKYQTKIGTHESAIKELMEEIS